MPHRNTRNTRCCRDLLDALLLLAYPATRNTRQQLRKHTSWKHKYLFCMVFSLTNPLLASAAWTPVYSATEMSYSAPKLLYPDPPTPVDSLPASYFTDESSYNTLNPPIEKFIIRANLSESSATYNLGEPFSKIYPLALDLRSSEIGVLGTTTCDNMGINSSMCFDATKYSISNTQSKKLTCTDQLESLAHSASFNSDNRQRTTKVRLIQKSAKPASWWISAPGRFGLSPYFLTCGDRAIPTFYDILTGVDQSSTADGPDYAGFGLSIDGEDGGVLHLNGVSPPGNAVINWSQKSSVAAPVCIYNWSDKVSLPSAVAAHYGVLYGLSICNVDLLGGLMQSHGFTVDLREPCLVLPATFFSMLTTWIPATCQSPPTAASANSDGPVPLPCNITDGTDAKMWTDLEITFQLTPNGENMSISLKDLVFDYPDGQKGLCIKSAGLPLSMPSVQLLLSPLEVESLPEAGPALASRDIVLGSRALRNLYVAFDYASGRIGLSAKKKANGTSTCATTTTICSGTETYYQPLNTCLPPICDSYLFQQLNTEGSSCEFAPEAKYTVIVATALLVAVEFIQGVVYVRFVRQAQTLCARS